MSKKILVLALAFVVGITVAAFAEVQNVKVGGDITTVWLNRDNLGFTEGANSVSDFATITRIKVEANLTDNVDAVVRLLNERIWSSTNENTVGGATAGNNADTTIAIDEAYVTLKDFLKDTTNVPLTLKVGRQNIRIGSGLLLGDPDTNQGVSTASGLNLGGIRDLSARKSFDAIVGVLDYNPLTVTAGFVKGNVGTAAAPDVASMKDDANAVVINAAYDTGVKSTVAELTYLLFRQNASATTTKGDSNNYGVRLTSQPIENLSLEGEFVFQDSETTKANKKRQHASDDAIRLGANYAMPSVAWKPAVGLDYTRLSSNWNVLFEDQTPAELANLIFPNSNIQAIGGSVAAKPKDDVTLKLRYASFAVVDLYDQGATWTSTGTGSTYTMTTEKHAGDEIDLSVAYDYTEDVQLGLSYAMFKPGDAFSTVNRDTASSVIGSMKVSF